ncbi:nitrite reductase [Sporomusaceae bacterium FL31]|nr:nitrite reductase [Sporomusaceae bacterium FL31]GCE34359.1 nitrite reductase [Sporomusaceae bacterium]
MDGKHDFIEKHGYIKQREEGLFAIRIRTIAGNLTSDQLRNLACLSDKYANGQVHITTRQSVELHWVQEDRLASIFQEIHDLGLLHAVRGSRIFTAIACPGISLCKKGICNTVNLAEQLDALMVGRQQPSKTKIALSGCPNSCAKPQINDIGLHGVIIPTAGSGCIGCKTCENICKVKAVSVQDGKPNIKTKKCINCGLCVRNCPNHVLRIHKQGYSLYIGGKIGKKPMLGHKIFTVIPEQEAMFYIENILGVYNRLAYKNERIGDVINRISLSSFLQEVLQHV